MGSKDFGPWVKHDWCPQCRETTEQTRFHWRFVGSRADWNEGSARCNSCAGDVVAAE